jgi:hypothetical protein
MFFFVLFRFSCYKPTPPPPPQPRSMNPTKKVRNFGRKNSPKQTRIRVGCTPYPPPPHTHIAEHVDGVRLCL